MDLEMDVAVRLTTAHPPSPDSFRRRQQGNPVGQSPKATRSPTRPLEPALRRENSRPSRPRLGTTSPKTSQDLRKRQLEDGLGPQNSRSRRPKLVEEAKMERWENMDAVAAREGRQFTVANVGNNGRIYLRPAIRPTNQRYAKPQPQQQPQLQFQPQFVFPMTPPGTAGLDSWVSQGLDESPNEITPLRSPLTPSYFQYRSILDRPVLSHQRARSYSTVDEQNVTIQDTDAGAFKVIIERPRTGPRDVEFSGHVPTLEVQIPSYRLGTPRFSMRGTAFLRSSSHIASDDVRSSIFSHGTLQRDMHSGRPTPTISRRHSDASPQPTRQSLATYPFDVPVQIDVPPEMIRRRSEIEPSMFDTLTFKPASDHPAIVRYSHAGAIRAAIPSRLVAEITSPSFVDYDLLSDFFLTFRSFLDTKHLLSMLIARLRWALARDDETGDIVRVRAFVALRHWILNYFLDDYVLDYELRKKFCELLNTFVDELAAQPATRKAPMKIVGELKKCWRRVCALYWDGPEFKMDQSPDAPVHPGGVAGSRDPHLDPSFWEKHEAGPPRLDNIIKPDFIRPDISSAEPQRNYFAEVSLAGHLSSLTSPVENRQDTAPGEPPLSPRSNKSVEVLSCSIPAHFPARPRFGETTQPLAAHPVSIPTSSVYDNHSPVATTPKALTGKRVRPTHAHKRSGSFSDSIRDNRSQGQSQQPPHSVQKVLYKSTELLLAVPYAGSLVRGNMFPPGQPFVDVEAPCTPMSANRGTTFFPEVSKPKAPAGMSGPGMKKLLGSVRRALSTRTNMNHPPVSSPTHGSFPHMPPLGVRGATINRLPGTALVPQACSRTNGATRIDLLGAEVAEDFKKAVEEDAHTDPETGRKLSIPGSENGFSLTGPTPKLLNPPKPLKQRPPMSVPTSGSQSIVIVDDTMPFEESAMMSGSLGLDGSMENFADAFMKPSADPTPPTTPPDLPMGTPRRSSHLLGQHVRPRSLSLDGPPSLVDDSRPSRDGEHSPQTDEHTSSHRHFARPSVASQAMSRRQNRSISLRRYASYQSGFTKHFSERSFDATTFSELEETPLSNPPSALRPIRALRRRPGGDLRAVSNVGDLYDNQLRRVKSTGSLTTYSESDRSSYMMSGESQLFSIIGASDPPRAQKNATTFSVGALANASNKRTASLFSTHSSQPRMSASFEKSARILAEIPDDADDDGGIESALAKLEGKFEQRRSEISSKSLTFGSPGNTNSFGITPTTPDGNSAIPSDVEDKWKHRLKHVVNTSISRTPPAIELLKSPFEESLQPTVYRPQDSEVPLSPMSIDSYNSTPLLDRGLTDDEDRIKTADWSGVSMLRDPSSESRTNILKPDDDAHSYAFFDGSVSAEKDVLNRAGSAGGHDDDVAESFLNLDTESDANDPSDLSSELSQDEASLMEHMVLEAQTPTQMSPEQRPPTPRISASSCNLSKAMPKLPTAANHPNRQTTLVGQHKPLPPTPEGTPNVQTLNDGLGGSNFLPLTQPVPMPAMPEPSRKTSSHLPFILAFDSQILAQQFTLIEKDALNEIDWKDLIERRWKDAHTESRSWVNFLRKSEPRGVEVVIARFNLMVKWAVSECVLTRDLQERVRCLIKYIHIAAHCRKYRNFATMTQITVALTSKDISRLSETWQHVPARDVNTLREMEMLVSPYNNFHSLRAEMEGSGADQGCIPFVGIYTHDLVVNSERPSQIASTPTTEPLVNFDKCRTDAMIVKNLLRLLEASSLYRFLPIEGITERCLWMAALSDTEIIRYGYMIQA